MAKKFQDLLRRSAAAAKAARHNADMHAQNGNTRSAPALPIPTDLVALMVDYNRREFAQWLAALAVPTTRAGGYMARFDAIVAGVADPADIVNARLNLMYTISGWEEMVAARRNRAMHAANGNPKIIVVKRARCTAAQQREEYRVLKCATSVPAAARGIPTHLYETGYDDDGKDVRECVFEGSYCQTGALQYRGSTVNGCLACGCCMQPGTRHPAQAVERDCETVRIRGRTITVAPRPPSDELAAYRLRESPTPGPADGAKTPVQPEPRRAVTGVAAESRDMPPPPRPPGPVARGGSVPPGTPPVAGVAGAPADAVPPPPPPPRVAKRLVGHVLTVPQVEVATRSIRDNLLPALNGADPVTRAIRKLGGVTVAVQGTRVKEGWSRYATRVNHRAGLEPAAGLVGSVNEKETKAPQAFAVKSMPVDHTGRCVLDIVAARVNWWNVVERVLLAAAPVVAGVVTALISGDVLLAGAATVAAGTWTGCREVKPYLGEETFAVQYESGMLTAALADDAPGHRDSTRLNLQPRLNRCDNIPVTAKDYLNVKHGSHAVADALAGMPLFESAGWPLRPPTPQVV